MKIAGLPTLARLLAAKLLPLVVAELVKLMEKLVSADLNNDGVIGFERQEDEN